MIGGAVNKYKKKKKKKIRETKNPFKLLLSCDI